MKGNGPINRWRRLTLGKKILLSYSVFFLTLLLIIFMFFQQALQENMLFYGTFMEQSNREISSSIDVIFSNSSRIANIHYFDPSIRALLRDEDADDPSKQVQYQEKMSRFISTAILGNRFVIRGTFISPYGQAYSNISTASSSYNKMVMDLADSQNLDGPEDVYYTDVYESTIWMTQYQTISIIQRIYYGKTYLGVVSIDLDYERICEQLDASYSNESSGVIMLIKDDSIIYTSHATDGLDLSALTQSEKDSLLSLLKNESFETGATCELNGKSCLLSFQKNEETGWIIVQAIPASVFYALTVQNFVMVLVYSLILFLGVTVFSLYYLRRTTHPLTVLDQAITSTGTETVPLLDIPAAAHNEDEISHLVLHYNEMAKRINDDIQKTYINELHRRQMQVKMLQFQINPHFIYNTLNIISSIAELNDVPEIVTVSHSLSEVLRYNIKGSDIVTVEQEILQVKNYMQIQFVRFPNRFIVDYDISNEASQCTMLKFLLQPLVENSIQHAFTALRPHDHLKISAFLEDGDLFLSIWDDGCGIDDEEVEALNASLHKEYNHFQTDSQNVGIGLRNVNDRIRSYYGNEYGITVESCRGMYTRIEIHIRSCAVPPDDPSREEVAKE